MQSSHVWPKDKANVCAGEPSFGFQNKELEHLLLVKDMFPICKLQQLSPPFDQAMQCNVVQAGPEIVIWEIYEIFGRCIWPQHSWNCQVHRPLAQILE